MNLNSDLSLPTTRWKHPESDISIQDILSHELQIDPILAQILINRSIRNSVDAKLFLAPSLLALHNPFLMKDMKKGVNRLIKAIYNREKMMIYGDYDADGITSVAILYKFLQRINVDVHYRIPNRFSEGYSLNRTAIDEIKASGASLILTVDCGVSDYEHVDYASSQGIDIIVLDHHEIPEKLPKAAAVINTNRTDCQFPFKSLAGVGIVFNFLIALRGELRTQNFWNDQTYPNLRDYLDLVALGTIGDIVPLLDENRIFAKIGLDLINEGKNIGLQALKEVGGIDHQPVDSGTASYNLIPRLNAAGRIASAEDALKLLLTEDRSEALNLARKLESYNRERQLMERNILDEIFKEIAAYQNLNNCGLLFFSSENWHPGVIGIVASRLVDIYYRPAILISLKNGIGKGSGRSIAEFNLHESLSKCQHLLLAHGGHRYAAGLSIKEEEIAKLKSDLEEMVSREVEFETLFPKTAIDAQCNMGQIKYDLISQLKLLGPFGNKNPEPVLCIRNAMVGTSSIVGHNHLTMRISADGSSCNSIWFNKGHLCSQVSGARFDIVFTPQINRWNGGAQLQLKMRDMALIRV